MSDKQQQINAAAQRLYDSNDPLAVKATRFFNEVLAIEYSGASLADLLAQIEACGYRCEAGALELNVAFMELKRRAEAEAEREKMFPGRLERSLLIAVRQTASACLDFIYEFEQVPDGELQDALHAALQWVPIPCEEVDRAYKIIEAHGITIPKARSADE